jgi:hypothetical protein
MDAIPPALRIEEELRHLASPWRVLQEWDRPTGAGDLDAPIKNYVAHLGKIIL